MHIVFNVQGACNLHTRDTNLHLTMYLIRLEQCTFPASGNFPCVHLEKETMRRPLSLYKQKPILFVLVFFFSDCDFDLVSLTDYILKLIRLNLHLNDGNLIMAKKLDFKAIFSINY